VLYTFFSLWVCSFTKKSKAQRRFKVDMVEIINERSTGTQAHRPEQISNLVCRASADPVSANAKGRSYFQIRQRRMVMPVYLCGELNWPIG